MPDGLLVTNLLLVAIVLKLPETSSKGQISLLLNISTFQQIRELLSPRNPGEPVNKISKAE